MKQQTKISPLDFTTLRFRSQALNESFDDHQQRSYSQGQIYLVVVLIAQFLICGILFIISNFSYAIIPLILLNLISTVLQAALSTYRYILNQLIYILSSGSVVACIILMSTVEYDEGYISNYKSDLYFAGGVSLLLLNCIFSSQWILKILSITVSAVLFIIFFKLGVVASVITGLALVILAVNIYRLERNMRIQFLSLQRKRQSLQNWEKFLDANYQDSVFIINASASNISSSSSNNNNNLTINKQRPSIDRANYKTFQQDLGNEDTRGKVQYQPEVSGAVTIEQIKGFNFHEENTLDKKQRIPQLFFPETKIIDIDQHSKLEKNNLKSNQKLSYHSQMLDDVGEENAMNFSQKITKGNHHVTTQNKFSQNQLEYQKSSQEDENLELKFQNLSCQKEFYQRVNQNEYFLLEMSRLTVHVPFDQAVELQFSQELPQQNIDKPRNFQFMNGKGNNLNPYSFTYNHSASSNQMVSSSRLHEFDYKNPKKYYTSSLTEFLQKKIWVVRNQELNSQQNTASNSKSESKMDWSMFDEEDNDFFESTEIGQLENCERKVNSGFGYQTKYYNIHLYKCSFKGNASIMGIMKDVTDSQRYSKYLITENSKEKLMQSLVHEMNAPLNKLANCIDALNDNRIDHRHATDVAKQNCMQVSFIVSDIIDYFRIVNHKLEIKKGWFTANQLQLEISKVFEEQMKERCILFEFDCMIEPYEKINSDLQRLKQIIVNQISLALKYMTEGNIKVTMSYYDTKKETIEFTVSHTESFLPKEIIEQMRQSFQSFDHKYELFTSGKNLQLLLCQGIIERIGPSSFYVKQDEGFVEVRFKIYSNYSQVYKQHDSRTNFISFNRDNNQAFFDNYSKKSQSKIDHSASQAFKKNQLGSHTNIDYFSSGQGIQSMKNIQQHFPQSKNTGQQMQKRHSGGSPNTGRSTSKSQGTLQALQMRNHQPSLQYMLNQNTNQTSGGQQQAFTMYESACLLTEEIGEKRDFTNDQQVHYIYKDYKMKSKYDIETTNTMSKIRSTADTFEMDFLEDLKRFLNYSRILIVSDQQEDIDCLVKLLQSKVKELEIHNAENSRIALQKIIDADNDSFQYSNPDLNYRLIIMSVSTKSGDTFSDVKKMKNYISQLPNKPNTPIILVSKEHDENHLVLAEEVGALALIFHPLSLENLSLCLKKFNKIPSLNQF